MSQWLSDLALLSLSHIDYQSLRTKAVVLEQDRHGDKVLQLSDGSYLKLFRRKRLLSSTVWYPYAQRFADNASALAQLRIACPKIAAVYRIPSIARDAVHYTPLAGRTLRQIISSNGEPIGLRMQLGRFVAQLHESGIYFRSLHLGNIVLTPDGALGLIDIADLRTSKRPLPAHRRRRNLQHLLRDAQDRSWLQANSAFDTAYREALEASRR